MVYSKKVTQFILGITLSILLSFGAFQSAFAHTQMATPSTLSIEKEAKVIIIIIIIKKKKKGVFEITDMRMGSESAALANNEVLAEASVSNGQLSLRALKGQASRGTLVTGGFKVPSSISAELGAGRSLRLKTGSINFGTSKLGNFEIQD